MRTLGILILAAGAALAQQTPFPADRQRTPEEAAAIAQAQAEVQRAKAAAALAQAMAQSAARRQEVAQRTKEIVALEASLAEARKQLTESNPKIADLKAQLDRLRAGLFPLGSGLGTGLAQQNPVVSGYAYAYSTGSQAAPFPKTSTGLPAGLPDRWWKNEGAARYVGLTATQQKQMDDVFQQSKPKLIDLTAALEKEEVALQPLVSADTLNESKIASQIDRVAQARAELEKANGRMLLGIRKTLSAEQWNKLGQMPFVTEKR